MFKFILSILLLVCLQCHEVHDHVECDVNINSRGIGNAEIG